MEYRFATVDDVPQLLEKRLEFLKYLHGPNAGIPDLECFTNKTRDYLTKKIPTGRMVCVVAVDNAEIVSLAMADVYDRAPSALNPCGRYAYIFNVYTVEGHKGNGHFSRLWAMLMDHFVKEKVGSINLTTTDAGRPIYEHYGFNNLDTYMIKPLDVPVAAQ